MKTNEVKQEIYVYLKNKLSKKFPETFVLNENNATNKIFWSKGQHEKPARPFVELDEIYKNKIRKRYNSTYINNTLQTTAQWQLTVKFEVRTTSNEGNLLSGEYLAVEIIDYIERLFTNSQETFDYFRNKGIIINELEASGIRDLSKFMYTNNEFVFSIDIPFQYDDIEISDVVSGECVEIEINVDNQTDNTIRMEEFSNENL